MPLVRIILRGYGAWVALYNSACALRDDAFTLIRSTEPDSPERITGTSGGRSPRSTGHVHAGIRGTDDMGRDHAQWVTWKVGIVGIIERESMQAAVARQIDVVIQAGLKLIDASVSARSTTDPPWAGCHNDLNDAIKELTQLCVHIPVDPDPIKPNVLGGLVKRLIAENRRLDQVDADGLLDASGYPESMEQRLRAQTWGREMEECEAWHAFWLDRTTIDPKSQRTTRSQRVMAVLFELGIAMGMLKKGPAAEKVVAAYQAVRDQPYWVVETIEQWEGRTGHTPDMRIRYPLMTTILPLAVDAISRLQHAVDRYSSHSRRQPRRRAGRTTRPARQRKHTNVGITNTLSASDFNKLERLTPALEKDKGAWMRSDKAAALEDVDAPTLATYRAKGQKNKAGSFGRDEYGRVWRKGTTVGSRPWYLVSSLLCKRNRTATKSLESMDSTLRH